MDPLARAGVSIGGRASLRVTAPDGPGDIVGVVTALDDASITMRRRGGSVTTLPRAAVTAARVVPLVARGRNPHHFARDQVCRLAHDETVGGAGDVWVGRLAELVSSLDDSGVSTSDGLARHGSSAARVFGEWAAMRLEDPDDLAALGAWAALHDARNVAVTGPGATGVRGLEPLQD
ncbi:hypothetical protein GCM10027418_16450 [Mariniluteicoccus endophyticus]